MNEAERIEKFKLELKTLIGKADLPLSIVYYVLKEQYQELKEIYSSYELSFLEQYEKNLNKEDKSN